MTNKASNPSRRTLLLGTLGVTAGAGVLVPSRWSKPVINRIMTPAHAQASVCPMVMAEVVTPAAPPSGDPTLSLCGATFEIRSGDAASDLTISAISNTALGTSVTLSYDGSATFTGPVTASNASGPRISWVGPVVGGASECLNNPAPVDDITLTVTATCSVVGGGEFTQDITLASILAA